MYYKPGPSLARLRELLDYNPKTGIFTWRVDRPGIRTDRIAGKNARNTGGYVMIKLDGQGYGAHRLAWFWMYGKWPIGDLDHKNRIRSDNRIDNLRKATRPQNVMNGKIRFDNTQGVTGISLLGKKYRAYIYLDGKYLSLGWHTSRDRAIKIRRIAEELFFGEFVRE